MTTSITESIKVIRRHILHAIDISLADTQLAQNLAVGGGSKLTNFVDVEQELQAVGLAVQRLNTAYHNLVRQGAEQRTRAVTAITKEAMRKVDVRQELELTQGDYHPPNWPTVWPIYRGSAYRGSAYRRD